MKEEYYFASNVSDEIYYHNISEAITNKEYLDIDKVKTIEKKDIDKYQNIFIKKNNMYIDEIVYKKDTISKQKIVYEKGDIQEQEIVLRKHIKHIYEEGCEPLFYTTRQFYRNKANRLVVNTKNISFDYINNRSLDPQWYDNNIEHIKSVKKIIDSIKQLKHINVVLAIYNNIDMKDIFINQKEIQVDLKLKEFKELMEIQIYEQMFYGKNRYYKLEKIIDKIIYMLDPIIIINPGFDSFNAKVKNMHIVDIYDTIYIKLYKFLKSDIYTIEKKQKEKEEENPKTSRQYAVKKGKQNLQTKQTRRSSTTSKKSTTGKKSISSTTKAKAKVKATGRKNNVGPPGLVTTRKS